MTRAVAVPARDRPRLLQVGERRRGRSRERRRASSSCSASAAIAPAPAPPASTQPVSATTMQRLVQLGPVLDGQHPRSVTSDAPRPTRSARRRRSVRVASPRRETPHLHRAAAGRDLRPAARGRPAHRGARLRRVLPLRPLPAHRRGRARARLDRRVDDARRARPRDVAHPARHARHAGDVPAPRAARDPGRAGRRDERRPRRARPRRGLVRRASTRRTASRSRRPATASRCSRSSSRSSPALWTTPAGETFSFAGKHYQLDDSPALPKPVQQPRPPIIIGGWGTKRTPRLAARYADEFNMPFAPRRLLPRRLRPRARRVREDRPRSRHRCATRSRSSCASGATRPSSRGAPRRSATSPTSCAPNARGRHARPRSSSASTRSTTAGAETVYLQVLDLDDLDHLRLIAAEVAPHV